MEELSFWKPYQALASILLSNCFVLQVLCQCDDATRPLMMSSSFTPQYFYSPDYPSNYPPNADCAWYIEAPSEYDKIILNIEEFRSQQDEFLTIYEGANTKATMVLQIDDTNQKATNAFVSSGHQLYFTFQSDGANEQKGFNILFFSNNSANQYACGETVPVTSSSEQTFMSPNLPNPFTALDSCHWYFTSTSGNIVFQIKFLDMNSCKPEYLTFYDGNWSSGTELEQTCYSAYSYDIYTAIHIETTSAQAFVDWIVSDENDDYYGFMLTFGLGTDTSGINITYPLANDTVDITIPENFTIGNVNESTAVIILTYSGDFITLTIDPRYSSTTDGDVSLSDTQVFGFTGTQPNRYLTLTSSLDYETIDKFSLLVTLIHPDITTVTYSVTFNVTITDVDDVAPTFLNLPSNDTLKRSRKAGYHLFVVNASDGDGTAENRVVTFYIFSGDRDAMFDFLAGDRDAMFDLDKISGELTLAKDSNQIPLGVDQYDLNIVAYSGSQLGTFAMLTILVDPDSPPVCTLSTVWADTLDITIAIAGTVVRLLDTWSCSDDNNNITYTIESVNPNVTTALFVIDASTGGITLLRKVTSTEVANRQFLLEIGATDSVGQTEIFSLYMNVTALSCFPNPRNLYVRMDQELGGAILSDFNCTITQGLTYSQRQYPPGTFAVNTYANGNAEIVLKASVVKIKFYSLKVTITDGVDIAVLEFKVIVQTKRCGIANEMATLNGALKKKINLIIFIFGTAKLISSMFT